MTWQDIANKHVNSPVVFVEIAFDSGTRYYSTVYVKTPTRYYKGNIISLPELRSSIGGIEKTYERDTITIIFDDTDYEFRSLEESEAAAGRSFKNITVTVKIPFADDSFATPLTRFTGKIFNWTRLGHLQFRIEVEETGIDLESVYPTKMVSLNDYPKADPTALRVYIQSPYGTISDLGLADIGAFGYPSLASGSGLPMVDTTVGSERHLVALQAYAELVHNGEFDPQPYGWYAGNSATLASAANGKIGKCLSITENGVSWPNAWQNITVRPGSVYRVHGYVKAGTENEYSVWIWDVTNGAWIVEGTWETEAAGDWSTEFAILFTAPSGCVSARICLYSRSLDGEGKTIYYDGVTATEVISVPRVYKNGALQTEGSGNDYTIGYNLVGTESGFILNGGFADISDWTAAGPTTIASVGGGQAGNCLSVTENGVGGPYGYQDVTVIPGSRYYLNGYVKKGTENWFLVRVTDPATGETIGWRQGVATAAWTQFSLYFDVPSGCTTARIMLGSWSAIGTGKTIYYDTIVNTVIASIVHTTIDWETPEPTAADFISCDTIFGERTPVEVIKHFLESFCGVASADFNDTSVAAAVAIENYYQYIFNGSFYEQIKLETILNELRDEFELDMFWNKDGEICFKYLWSSDLPERGEIDYMEYANDGAAQAAYVSSDGVGSETLDQNYIAGTENHPFGSGSFLANSQGITVTANGRITKVEARIKINVGSPTGTIYCYLYSDNAGTPQNLLGTFSTIDASIVTGSYAWYSFIVAFADAPEVVNGMVYHIVWYFAGDASNHFHLEHKSSANPYAGGYINYGVTVPPSAPLTDRDFNFKQYYIPCNLIAESEDTIKQQGSYSLKGIAKQTGSLNDYLERAVAPTIDLSGRDTIEFDLRASRTGANIKVGIHDSGGVWTEITHTILTVNTWERVTWDISGVINANKDAIDKVRITIVNADANNTFYIDGMFAEMPTTAIKIYTDFLDILEGFESDPQVLEIVNEIDFEYNFNYSKSYYYSSGTREDANSKTKHGATFRREKSFKHIRSAMLAQDVAGKKVMRLKNPVVFNTVPLPLKSFSDELGDVVRITHFEGEGASGYTERLVQIKTLSFNIDRFINLTLLEDVSIFFGESCILGNNLLLAASWLDASEADRAYCYLCNNATGKFSDGMPGKKLY